MGVQVETYEEMDKELNRKDKEMEQRRELKALLKRWGLSERFFGDLFINKILEIVRR